VQKHENLTAKCGRKSIEQYKKINMLHMYDELQMRAAYKKIFFNAKEHLVFVQIDMEYYLDIFGYMKFVYKETLAYLFIIAIDRSR